MVLSGRNQRRKVIYMTRFDENFPGDDQNFSRGDNKPNRRADDNDPKDNRHF